jgi:hypothetical protein
MSEIVAPAPWGPLSFLHFAEAANSPYGVRR